MRLMPRIGKQSDAGECKVAIGHKILQQALPAADGVFGHNPQCHPSGGDPRGRRSRTSDRPERKIVAC